MIEKKLDWNNKGLANSYLHDNWTAFFVRLNIDQVFCFSFIVKPKLAIGFFMNHTLAGRYNLQKRMFHWFNLNSTTP